MASVNELSYVIYDHHKEHKYKAGEDLKQTGMMSKKTFSNFFAAGPIGASFKQGIKTKLGFKKHEEVMLMVGLKGDSARKQMIADLASFEQFQSYLARTTSSVAVDCAGIVEVEMHIDSLVKNRLAMDESQGKSSHKRPEVQLMVELKKETGKGASTKWTPQCTEIFASSDRANVELQRFLEAREQVKLAFGDANYLLNPVTVLCPLASCKMAMHVLNGLSGISHFFSPASAHLKTAHQDDPVAERLLKRLAAAVQSEEKGLLTPETLDAKEGCKLKLNSEWLDANMAPAAGAPKLSKLRKPADYTRAIFCVECENEEEARRVWITANKPADVHDVD